MPDTNFCITFTTIPSRIKALKKTIKSIEKQTLKPNKIFLNIPYKYHRFPNTKILDSDLKNLKSELLEVSRCDDFGPATKIMGSLEKVKKYDCSIIIDDDHIYDNNFCEIFINAFEKERKNYSFYMQKIFDIEMAQCADGFLIENQNLDLIEKFYYKYVKNNKNLFLDDDLWISIYLQKIKLSKIENLIEIFRNKTGKYTVYDIHTSIDALSEKIHSPKKFLNRRKIAKIEYLKFTVKNYFSNFNQS
jgi:hypothetical protein